jgi:hypothetical protein
MMATNQVGRSNAKLLAAYRLGYSSRMFPVWHRLFQEKPEFEWGTAEGVLATIDEMKESLIVLAVEIPENFDRELRPSLDEEGQTWTTILAEAWEYTSKEETPGTNDDGMPEEVFDPEPSSEDIRRGESRFTVTGRHDASPLWRDFLNRAFLGLTELRPWYLLGAKIGEYHEALERLNSGSLPPLSVIVGAARSLSPESIQALPFLATLQDLTDNPNRLSPREFLTTVIEATGKSIDEETYKEDCWDKYVTSNLLFDLDWAIQKGLQKASDLPVLPEGSGSVSQNATVDQPRPDWDSQYGKLWLGTKLARKVAPQASRIRKLLDEFQAKGWPDLIRNPFMVGHQGHPDPKRMRDPPLLHSTIKSVNRRLKGMRFHADGTGTGIAWSLDPDSLRTS